MIIPTYEEAETIGQVIESLSTSFPARAFEIVVVDDSPGAETATAAAAAPDPGVRVSVVRREDGSGLGTAVLRGFDEARGDRLVVMDGDGQHPPQMALPLGDRLRNSDMAFGSRHAMGDNDADWSQARVVISLGASGLAWAAIPDARRLQDPMSGMFAVRREVVEAVRDRLEPDGFKIGLELLARAPIDRVAEVPIRFAPRAGGKSTFDLKEAYRYLRHLSRLAVATRRRPRPSRTGPEVDHVDA